MTSSGEVLETFKAEVVVDVPFVSPLDRPKVRASATDNGLHDQGIRSAPTFDTLHTDNSQHVVGCIESAVDTAASTRDRQSIAVENRIDRRVGTAQVDGVVEIGSRERFNDFVGSQLLVRT